MNRLVSSNPSQNYLPLGEVAISTPEEIKQKVAAAHRAQHLWYALGVEKRVEILGKVIAHFAQDQERLALLMAQEMGMPLKEARSDMTSGIAYFNSYLDTAAAYLQECITYETASEIHQVYHEPYGVAAVIVAWNFPFSNFVWQCGQNLVAGNTVVFKCSEETPLFGKEIEKVLTAALPLGVFNEVYGDGIVGELLLQEDINLICFTGSSKVGCSVNQLAAQRLISTVLELGGSAPGIIFADSDIDAIKDTVFLNRFTNCGQMCDALKRLIVHESKVAEVIAKLAAIINTKQIGDAANEETDIGPLVAKRQLDLLEQQVADAIEKGANVIVGGKRPEAFAGAYYQPTLLTNITYEMRVWREEVFGPVLPIVTFATEEEAIALANDTPYGLGAYLFTQDSARFLRVAHQLQTGMVAQNNLSYVNVHNPFGGYKMSGNGREHAQFGFNKVTQIKAIAREK
ncbi:MAG: aldehyde dehydrogenase family protein [Candidatus Abawacabacteria bacterium]|nr:aldehyde dehydrogenase family protein [Candidatus Abawacabacteria bacterium]